ncbi:p17/29c-like protein [Anaeramoeba flamelloides]|uniref:P17/29c-like protein n=1 Tax=Anaeramoeba flamelloides TaxID=1746091 RepID=A0AAV8AB49_9EUKA|nr:p17/29c-like protein [Anaeramoeba flamelloides]
MLTSDSETTSDSDSSYKVGSSQSSSEYTDGSSSGEYTPGETSTSDSSGSNSQVSSYEERSGSGSGSESEYESESRSRSDYESGRDNEEQYFDGKKQKQKQKQINEKKKEKKKKELENENQNDEKLHNELENFGEDENDENQKEQQKQSSKFDYGFEDENNEKKKENKIKTDQNEKEKPENENEINYQKEEKGVEKDEIEQYKKKKDDYEKHLAQYKDKYSYRTWERKMKSNDLNRINQITKEMNKNLTNLQKMEKEIQILNENNRKLKEENMLLDGDIHSLKNLKKKTKKEFSAQVAKNELYNKKQLQRSKHNNVQLRILNDKAKNSEFAKYYLSPNKVLKNFKYQIKDNFSYFVDENTKENNLLKNIYTISRLCFFQVKEFLLQYESKLFTILKIKQVQTSQFINVFLDKIKNKCHQLILDPNTKNKFFTQARKNFPSITQIQSDLYEKIKEFFYTICQCYLDLLICDHDLQLLEKMGQNKDPKFTYPLNEKLDGEWIYCFPGLKGKLISLTNYVFVL